MLLYEVRMERFLMLARISMLIMDLLILYFGRRTQKKNLEILVIHLLCPLHIKIRKRPKRTFSVGTQLCVMSLMSNIYHNFD